MRQIGSLPTRQQAETFADYLLTLTIQTQTQLDGSGWAIWVCDEDRVPQAKQELEAFGREPQAAKYAAASRAAATLRRQEEEAEDRYRRRQAQARARLQQVWEGRASVTYLLILACVGVAIASRLGEDTTGPVVQALVIAPFEVVKTPEGKSLIAWQWLDALRGGQFWRLFSPCLLHFGLIHLLFNMMALYDLGRLIEPRRGRVRFIALVLVLAAASNLAQYYLGATEVSLRGITIRANPQFGGMSGVLFGLFGYAWMKTRYAPELGITLNPTTITYLMVWFVLCWAGFLGSIANVAHTVGLLGGILIGIAPHLLPRRRG